MKHIVVLAALTWLSSVGLAAEFPPSADAGREIATLRREIARHDDLYHRQAAPEISDAEYDRLKRRLTALERDFPHVAHSAPPVAEIGDDRSGLFATQRHRVPMRSLEKANSVAEVRAFHARLVKTLERDDLEYVIEPKYDGLAISVTYENGRLVRAVTRGNGVDGDDITANVRQIDGVRAELRPTVEWPAPKFAELRGEIYVPMAEFVRVNAEREMAGEPPFANPRNLAAGTVRQKDARDLARRGLRIVFFGLGDCDPAALRPKLQTELQAAFRAWGLPAAELTQVRGGDALLRGIEMFGTTRAALPFATDGAVIKLDSVAERERVGMSEHAPRWALAYKYEPDRVETELRAITLQVGRSGVLTPVAELAPVEVGGSKVTRATLHNRDEVARKDLRIGDFVYVEKAGDVIPAVVGVNLARRPPSAKPFAFPVTCPDCYSSLVSRPAESAVYCPNFGCPAQVRRRVEHFASKACLNIEGLGPAMIDVLVGHGWVKDLPDLYRLQRTDLLTLGKNHEKSVERLLGTIEKSKRAELWRVIHGLGLPQVGSATAKDLARQCGTLPALAECGPKALTALGEPRFQGLIAELIALGVSPAPDGVREDGQSKRVIGKTFVVTGTLPTLTRAQVIARIETAGGFVAGAVSPKTDYVVVGTDAGAKLEQARTLGVQLLDEAALLEMLDGK